MINIYWLNPPLYTRDYYPDIAWMNFNTFLPEYNWIEPIIDWEVVESIEFIIDEIIKNETEILCISTYVWNHALCHAVCKSIKEINPNIVIIQGGPHQGFNNSFFDSHPYIDYLCYSTGHGEYFLKEFLRQYKENRKITNPELIPYFISRYFKNSLSKMKYEFPETSSLENNMAYMLEVKNTNKKRKNTSTIIYETTRGCPYACVYCEWGGGISTKISQKSLELVKKELEIISIIGYDHIEIADANFGILKRDEEVAKYIAELKDVYNYPKTITLYGLAKTTVEKREKILDIFYEKGLMKEYFIGLQSLKSNVLTNIMRTDISVEDNMKLAKKYYIKYSADPLIDFIMGMPGNTLEEFYEQMDYYKQINSVNVWLKVRNLFTLLPDSPANDSNYLKKYKIKYSILGSIENEENQKIEFSNSVINKYKSSMHVVTETYSYTADEWKEMFFLNRMQRELGPLLKEEVKASEFFKIFYNHFKRDILYLKIKKHLDDIVDNELSNKDVLLIDNEVMERLVFENYVKDNKEFYSQYLNL